MFCVQDQVNVSKTRRIIRGLFTFEHPEPIGRVAQ